MMRCQVHQFAYQGDRYVRKVAMMDLACIPRVGEYMVLPGEVEGRVRKVTHRMDEDGEGHWIALAVEVKQQRREP